MLNRPSPAYEHAASQPMLSLEQALLLLGGAVGGALLAVLVAPAWVPGLADSLAGPEPKAAWYLSRASGLVAYLLLWLSVLLGLSLSGRLARLWPGGPTAVDLHQFSGLLGLAFATFHALVLMGDRYIGYGLVELLVPFAGQSYRPFWVGLGQIGLLLGLLVGLSFYARRWIGYRAWRTLHLASLGVYLLATVHGLGAGTDSSQPAVLGLYLLSSLSTYTLTIVRIFAAVRQPRRQVR